MTEFTPYMSFAGGLLIGLSAVLLMLSWGRIAGMTGIVIGVFPPLAADWGWRAVFLIGAIIAPVLLQFSGIEIAFTAPVSLELMVVGGLIAGIGVTYGSGCTSGHGVCGVARLSTRSFVATGIFMLTAFATVFLMRHVF